MGQSGSGKSNVLMSTLMKRISAKQLIYVIDVKQEITPLFGKYITSIDIEKAEETFKELLDLAEIRRQLFADTSKKYELPVRDYGEYFTVTGEHIDIVTVFVEELIVLLGTIDEELLVKLLVLGRSAGIYVVALSQYINAKILSRQATINFSTIVFLGKFDRITSNILFGNLDKKETDMLKEYLGSPGRAAIMEDGKLSTRNMPRVNDTDLIPYIKGQI